ncbi:MAG: phosphopyruvate hydratase [Desulfurococcales archaeon]|nr:phosphopyruvate hydratase [Desulfurococcales archaeon]
MNPFEIRRVLGRMVLDSRGKPTVKVIVETNNGWGYGYAPSGASRGEREAVELRDGGRKWRGLGVSRALAALENHVAPRLVGMDSRDQSRIDHILIAIDGTPNKARIGGNTTTATSIAVARAASNTAGLELFEYLGGPMARLLPTPLLNIINGGVHAGNELSIQEFMIIPVGADSFHEAMRMAVETYWSLKDLLKEKYGLNAVNVGDEGGFAPPMKKTREALEALKQAIEKAGYKLEEDFYLGIDAAASQFYDKKTNIYRIDGVSMPREELLSYYEAIVDEYPIKYIEDPFDEDDWDGFKMITEKLGSRVLIVGDDLYTTNVKYLRKGIEMHATNAVLVKVNQVGTLTETFDFVREAYNHGMRAVISHRSGETEDPFIADLAVGLGTGLIKTGAPARGERTAKYNRLLEIEDMLAGEAEYAGKTPFQR